MEDEDVTEDMISLHVKKAMEIAKGCFLCALEDELEREYMDTYISELVMDASSRQRIVESRGFCNSHYFKMLIEARKPESSDGHGIALVMRSVIEQLIQDVHRQAEKTKEPSKVQNELSQILPNEKKCPACIHVGKFISIYVEEFLEKVAKGDKSFLKPFEAKGFCLPHYATVLNMALNLEKRDEQLIKLIANVEEASLRKTDEQLAEYVKRQSYESEEKPDEETIFRAVSKLAGRRGARPILQFQNQGVTIKGFARRLMTEIAALLRFLCRRRKIVFESKKVPVENA